MPRPISRDIESIGVRTMKGQEIKNPSEVQTLKKATLFVVSLSSFMFPFMLSSVNIVLPAIQAEFSVHAVLLSWIATAYLLASGLMLVPAGKLGDIYGRKRIFIMGIAVFTVFSVCTAFAPSVAWIIAFRVLQGLGGAMSTATSMAIISDVFPVTERGKAMGIAVACVYIGLSVGPFAGGWLTALFGWRSVFLVNAPVGVLAFCLSIMMMKKEWANADHELFDIVGSLLYGGALFCFMYGLTSLPAVSGVGLLSGGLIGFVIFGYHVKHARFPVFNIRLFLDNRPFTFSSIAALINYSATFAIAFLLSLYFQYIKGMPPQTAGAILVVQPLVQAVFSPVAGKLSDRIQPAKIASLGMGLTTFGLLMLVFLTSETSLYYVVTSLAILGLGFGLFSSPNMNAIMSSVERNYYGIASGTVATMRLIGQMLSMAIATLTFSLMIGNKEISPLNYESFLHSVNLLFIVFSVSCMVGIFFSIGRGAIRKP